MIIIHNEIKKMEQKNWFMWEFIKSMELEKEYDVFALALDGELPNEFI